MKYLIRRPKFVSPSYFQSTRQCVLCSLIQTKMISSASAFITPLPHPLWLEKNCKGFPFKDKIAPTSMTEQKAPLRTTRQSVLHKNTYLSVVYTHTHTHTRIYIYVLYILRKIHKSIIHLNIM